MNRIDITHPYAHDLMLAALDVCIAGYPGAAALRPVENLVCVGLALYDNKLHYNPVQTINFSFNELCDVVHSMYIQYYLRRLPLCSYLPVPQSLQH